MLNCYKNTYYCILKNFGSKKYGECSFEKKIGIKTLAIPEIVAKVFIAKFLSYM